MRTSKLSTEKVLHDRDEPVTDSVIAQWINDLESDETKAERTIVLNIGEILLPDAESVSVVSLEMEDSSSAASRRRRSCPGAGRAGGSAEPGSLSVRIEEVTGSAGGTIIRRPFRIVWSSRRNSRASRPMSAPSFRSAPLCRLDTHRLSARPRRSIAPVMPMRSAGCRHPLRGRRITPGVFRGR